MGEGTVTEDIEIVLFTLYNSNYVIFLFSTSKKHEPKKLDPTSGLYKMATCILHL